VELTKAIAEAERCNLPAEKVAEARKVLAEIRLSSGHTEAEEHDEHVVVQVVKRAFGGETQQPDTTDGDDSSSGGNTSPTMLRSESASNTAGSPAIQRSDNVGNSTGVSPAMQHTESGGDLPAEQRDGSEGVSTHRQPCARASDGTSVRRPPGMRGGQSGGGSVQSACAASAQQPGVSRRVPNVGSVQHLGAPPMRQSQSADGARGAAERVLRSQQRKY